MTLPYLPDIVPLYSADFTADPQAVYHALRERHGAVAPVEIAPDILAHLVLDYRAAREVLVNIDGVWSKDPRPWQARLPDTPQAAAVLGMLGYRDNPLFTDGPVHTRYRTALTDCYRMVQPHRLRRLVRETADLLIREFAATGRADLVTDFAMPIPPRVFNRLCGRPDDDGVRLTAALDAMMHADGEDAARGALDFAGYMNELLAAERGDDLPSWLLNHPAALSREEVLQHLIVTMGAGYEPMSSLISNALSRMLTDSRYHATLTRGARGVHEALGEVLLEEPAMANYGPYFVTRTVCFHGTWIKPAELVLVSYAAANTTPAPAHQPPVVSGEGSHLAFGAGAHRCPASGMAVLIAATAIERILMYLPDMELTVPRDRLTWRPGPFDRSLATLPVRFTPFHPDQPGQTPWTTQ